MLNYKMVKGTLMECTKISQKGIYSNVKTSKNFPIIQEFDGIVHYDAKVLKRNSDFICLKDFPGVYIPKEKFSILIKLLLRFIIKYNKLITIDQIYFFSWDANKIGDKFVVISDT